jgi:hypothetical protein
LPPRAWDLSPARRFQKRLSPPCRSPRRVRGRALGFKGPDILVFLLLLLFLEGFFLLLLYFWLTA